MAHYVLLDRDGVINRRVQNGYVTSWNKFVFLPGALDALRLLHAAGYRLLVLSNQAGVGKGVMTAAGLARITERFASRVRGAGGRIEKVYYCTHSKQARCRCRKPRPGLIFEAQREFRFNCAETFMVGDSDSDLLAARRAGCPMILVNANPASRTKDWLAAPRAVVPSLKAAADLILSQPAAMDVR